MSLFNNGFQGLDDRDRRREKPIPPGHFQLLLHHVGKLFLRQNLPNKTIKKPPKDLPENHQVACFIGTKVPCYRHISKAIQRGFCSPKSLLFVQIPPGTTGPPITGHWSFKEISKKNLFNSCMFVLSGEVQLAFSVTSWDLGFE